MNNLDLAMLKQRIIEVFNTYEIGISIEQVDKLVLFADLLLCENEKFNLTRITSIEDIVYKHFLDSAYLIKIINKQQDLQKGIKEDLKVNMQDSINIMEQNNLDSNVDSNINNNKIDRSITTAIKENDKDDTKDNKDSNDNIKDNKNIRIKLLDIGSGAGFPGIVLAILTNMQITLVESMGKKANFLEMVKKHLKLESMIIINNRVENMVCFSSFDYATARALADLKTVVKYSWPFLKKGGCLLAQKGPKYVEEIKEVNLNKKNIKVLDIDKYLIQDLTRYLLVIQKH